MLGVGIFLDGGYVAYPRADNPDHPDAPDGYQWVTTMQGMYYVYDPMGEPVSVRTASLPVEMQA